MYPINLLLNVSYNRFSDFHDIMKKDYLFYMHNKFYTSSLPPWSTMPRLKVVVTDFQIST